MNYIVISDLHIGGNTKLDIFRSQDQLASFLKSLNEGPLALIINGDFIDFLAVDPFGVFNRAAAEQKIQKIVAAPPNQDVWKAFRDFVAADERNRIDILLGNHDVELVFEEVQTALAAAMGGQHSDRIRFLMDRLSYPRLVVGGVYIHLEHGFQYDPFNWYDHDKLIQATQFKQDGTNFELPVGSKLVYEVLNKVTPDHPFVPLLKPEPAVFWMMVALAPKEVLKRGGQAILIGSGTIKSSLRKFLRGGAQLAGETAPSELTPLQAQLTEMLFDKALTDDTVDDVEEFIDNGTGNEKPPAGVTFAGGPLLRGKLFLVRRALGALKYKRDSFFDPTRSDEFENALNTILNQGAKIALFGHSHSRKMLSLFKKEDGKWTTDSLLLKRPSILYLNTGTWADLLDFDLSVLANDDAAQKWLDELEAGKVPPTLVYTYVRLEELGPDQGVRVSLCEWRDGQAEVIKTQEILP